jgi:hypothetical protein
VSQRGVEIVLGRLATDAGLRDRFCVAPRRVLRALIADGIELSRIEISALRSLDRPALRRFAAAIDSRLQKARRP